MLLSSRPLPRRAALTSLAAAALYGGAPRSLRLAVAQQAGRGLDPARLGVAIERAAAMPRLQALVIASDGVEVAGHAFRGPGLDNPTNVKSVSKSVMAALAGIAIGRGVLVGVDQPVVPLLADLVPAAADPRLGRITVDHLLTMRAGLERTSGRNYGRWVNSDDWIGFVLSRPFVDEPGGAMLYSTGSYHLLSALLTQVSGESTLVLARAWLGKPLGIQIPPWTQDPQGIYLGGNNMALSPRALARFGELYRNGGRHGDRRVLPAGWVEASWTPRTRSRFSGHAYGYGWFIAAARGHRVFYARGFGGQMIYIVPDLALTVVMTSDLSAPSGRTGYGRALNALLANGLIPAAERGA